MLPPTWRLIFTTIAITSAIVVWVAVLLLPRIPESSPARRNWTHAAVIGVHLWWTGAVFALMPDALTEYQRTGWLGFYFFGNFLFMSSFRISRTLRRMKIQ